MLDENYNNKVTVVSSPALEIALYLSSSPIHPASIIVLQYVYNLHIFRLLVHGNILSQRVYPPKSSPVSFYAGNFKRKLTMDFVASNNRRRKYDPDCRFSSAFLPDAPIHGQHRERHVRMIFYARGIDIVYQYSVIVTYKFKARSQIQFPRDIRCPTRDREPYRKAVAFVPIQIRKLQTYENYTYIVDKYRVKRALERTLEFVTVY